MDISDSNNLHYKLVFICFVKFEPHNFIKYYQVSRLLL